MAVSTFLSPEALDRLSQSTGKAVGLPRETFTSAEFFAYEQEYVFARNWVFVCAVDELAQPGTAIPVSVAGRPVVVVSDKRGTIRAFHNVCSHRGTVIVTEPTKRLGVLRCPYHSWGYALDGALRTTPHFGGHGVHDHPDFDKSKNGLRPVRCEAWHRLVFVNLSNEGPSLAEFVAPLAKRWSIDYSALRMGGVTPFELKANWKLAIENFSESYHLPSIHPGLNSYSKMEDHYNVFVEGCGSGQASLKYAPPAVGGKRLPEFKDIPPHLEGRAEYLTLFPNLMIGTHPEYFFAITAEPVAPDRTRERFYLFFVGEEALREEYAAVRKDALDRWTQINLEDMGVVERMQFGRHSPAMIGGRFSPDLDACLHDFQKHLVRRLLDGERAALAERQGRAPIAAE